MEVCVLVKRVPAPGARIVLTPDGRSVDTTHLGFTVSPHEECAVEEAVRLVEAHGGRVTVMALGPPEAEEQLRDAVAIGAEEGVLVEAPSTELDPRATAGALAGAIELLGAEGTAFDLLLFGHESADAGNQQVPVRVATRLGLPIVGGVKGIEVDGGRARLRREAPDGDAFHELPLPAAVAVKEGINLPRYPALKGRMRARKAALRRIPAEPVPSGLELVGLVHPAQADASTEILGHGAEAAGAVADVLERQGVI